MEISEDRKCVKCGIEKKLHCFYSRKHKGQHRHECRECTKVAVSAARHRRGVREFNKSFIKDGVLVRTCRKCSATLPEEEFRLFKRMYGACNACNKDKLREYRLVPEHAILARERCDAWAKANPRRMREWKLREYGLTPEMYDAMLANQGGICAICGINPIYTAHKKLVVDHSHTRGHVRGLLCGTCNTGIGMLKDSIAILKSAIKYLEATGE